MFDTKGHRHKRIGKYFFIRDFAQSGGKPFRYARMDAELVTCLNEIRNQAGKPITVNSSYRSWGYNEKLIDSGVQASKKSFHLSGKAADIYIPSIAVRSAAKIVYQACGCGIGLGVANSWLHVDTRGKKVRPWGYSDTAKSRLAAARSVQKSMCGGGGRDYHELGQRMLNEANGAFQKIKNRIKDVLN